MPEAAEAEKRYTPAECIGCRKVRIEGDPDPTHVSTNYAERHTPVMAAGLCSPDRCMRPK